MSATAVRSGHPASSYLLAAILEAAPLAVFVAMFAITSPPTNLFGPIDAVIAWIGPSDDDPGAALRAVGLIAAALAYAGPGLGRIYLRDWRAVGRLFVLRASMLGAGFCCYVVFVFVFFGGSLVLAAAVGFLGAAALIAPFAVGAYSAAKLFLDWARIGA